MNGKSFIAKTTLLFIKIGIFTLILFWLTQSIKSRITFSEKDQYIEYIHTQDTLPAFFFSVVPRARAKTSKLHDSFYPQLNHFIRKKLQDDTRTDSVLHALHHLETVLFERSSPSTDTFHHLRSLVHALLRSSSESTFDSIMHLIQLISHRSAYPPTITMPLHKLVRAYTEEVDGSRFVLSEYIPTLEWHGLNNQYTRWIGSIVGGRYGISKIDGLPLSRRISSALQWTLVISVISLCIMLALGISLGMWMGIHHHSRWSKILAHAAFVVQSIPEFWLAVLLIVFLTTETLCKGCDIFPTPGILQGNPMRVWQTIWLNAPLFVLVFVVTTVGGIAYLALQVKNIAAREWAKPYRFALMSKGLPLKRITRRHLLPNAIFPLLGLVTVILPGLFTGSLVVEVLFHLPGMGKLLYESILYSDVAAIRLILLLIGTMTLIAYYLTDLVLMYFGHHGNPKSV